MKLSRYSVIDPYTLEELRRRYQQSDAKGRIRLLKELYSAYGLPPFEIALLAVEDPNVEVRQWIARNAEDLDYRESRHVPIPGDEELIETVYEFPDRDLQDRLKNDPDPFVRACLRENPHLHGGLFNLFSDDKWLEWFRASTHLERLALVRNPSADFDARKLIEKLFDPEDTELEIDMKEREELVAAFLSNRTALTKLEEDAGLSANKRPIDGYRNFVADEFLSKLWKLASKWPKESKLQSAVYSWLPGPDHTKAEIYRACDEPGWRQEILWNCKKKDTETIKLGMKDPDESCRGAAYSQVRSIAPELLESILKNEGKLNISTLTTNKSLPLSDLKQVRDRLSELNPDPFDLELADRTIRDKQRRVAKLEEELEDLEYEAEDENESENEKLDTIKKRLRVLEGKVETGTREIGQRLQEVVTRRDVERFFSRLSYIIIFTAIFIWVLLWLKNIFWGN